MVALLLTRSSENYNAAWELITMRYENKRKIFKTMIQQNKIKALLLQANLYEDVNVIFAHIIIRKFNRGTLQLYERSEEIQLVYDVIDF